jgi:nicotinamidase-related amidase
MVDQPTIPRASTVLILNDMINGNLRKMDNREHNKLIEESGIIKNSAKLVAALRERKVPIFWIRVERRADYADAVFTLTDAYLASGQKRPPATVRGSYAAGNVDELPVQPEDQVVLKPRINPFIATDLDYQLRARSVNTLLFGGYSTNGGVESGVRIARDLGYHVVVVSDCCYNVEKELHEFSLAKIMPKYARVLTSDQVLGLLA